MLLTKFIVTNISVFLFLFLFSSCEKKNHPPATQQILRISIREAPYTLNPNYTFDAHAQRIVHPLFEGCTRVDLDKTVQLGIAKSIDISPDQKIYTITLKETCWSNGQPLTAHDFAYAWKKALSKGSSAQLSDLFYCIKNAKEVREGNLPMENLGITVVDDYTLQIELTRPVSYFTYMLSNPVFSPACRKVDNSDPLWHQKDGDRYPCNGPFRLRKKRDDSTFILEKNPFYHDRDSVRLDELHFYVINDVTTAFSMYEKGEIDFYGEPFTRINKEIIKKLQEKNRLETFPRACSSWIFCNVSSFPLNSKMIRKAIYSAIDWKKIISHTTIAQNVAFSIVPDMLTKLKKEDYLHEGNATFAKQCFEEGLRELHLAKDQFPPIRFNYSHASDSNKLLAQLMKEQLRDVLGIQILLETCDFKSSLEKLIQGDYQLGSLGWIAYWPDATYHLEPFSEKSENNWTRWKHPQFQSYLDLAEQELDQAKRDEYLRQAEKILIDELPVIPISYMTMQYAKNEKLKNILITEYGVVDFKWAYFE